MVLPWVLIGRLALSAGTAFGASWLRSAERARRGRSVDLSLTLVIGAAVGGRLLVLAMDAVLLGSLPDVRALLTLGPGLSAPGALLGATVAGWRRRSQTDDTTWEDTGIAVAIGMAVFSGLHLPAVPIANVVRVVALVGTAVWLAKATRSSWHPGLRLLTALAGVHLLTGTLTPSLPTVDTDVDLLLTLVVVLTGLLTQPRITSAARQLAGVVGGVVGLLVLIAIFTAGAAPSLPSDVDLGTTASLDGAIRAGGIAVDVPAWGAAELAAFARDVDVPIVLNLWASWCPPCHAEAATVARAARALEGRAIVVGVLVDDEVEDGQRFADRYGLEFPTVVDAGLSEAIGMAGLPTTVILDRDGSVVRRVVGGLAQSTLAAAVADATTPTSAR